MNDNERQIEQIRIAEKILRERKEAARRLEEEKRRLEEELRQKHKK